MALKLDGLLFDKDGTLFDFESSWGPWCADLLRELSQNEAKARQMAERVHFDLNTLKFLGKSVLIHGTADEFLDLVMPVLPDWSRQELAQHVLNKAKKVVQIPVLPLAPLFDELRQAEITLGIATNDNETPAIAQLDRAGILDRFEFIAGCDSGFGAKPGHGMQTGFCQATGVDPHAVAMVGDSAHDLVSGRNAGMTTIAVLTGVATRAELSPLADFVLNDIGEIPALLF